MGFHPAIRRIRSGHSVAGPVCERAGYKTQSSFPSTAFFELFSATRRRPKNLRKEPTKVFSGPLRGPRATNCGRREEAIYAPPIRHASGFWSKITKPGVFHRTGSLASRTVDSGDCGHELIAEQAPASFMKAFWTIADQPSATPCPESPSRTLGKPRKSGRQDAAGAVFQEPPSPGRSEPFGWESPR